MSADVTLTEYIRCYDGRRTSRPHGLAVSFGLLSDDACLVVEFMKILNYLKTLHKIVIFVCESIPL